MIFLDANCFLRLIGQPPTPAVADHQERAAELFASIQAGAVLATTSEAVLAEVAFILTSKRTYNRPVSEAAAFLSDLLQLSGLRVPAQQRRHWLTALAFWAKHPGLGFVDALTSAIVTDQNHDLATFDHDFTRFPEVRNYWPQEQ